MKSNRFAVSVILAAVLAATSSSVFAASASEMAVEPLGESGLYAGFGFGYAPLSGSSSVNSSTYAFDGRVGYAVNRHVSVETAWALMGGINVGLTEMVADVLSVSAVGYYPIQDKMDVYGKLGYASANVGTSNWVKNESKTKTGVTYGFGVEFAHGDKTSFRLGMDHYDLAAWSTLPISANNFSFSADFRF